MSIQRGLQLKLSLEIYLLTYGGVLQADILTEDDWQHLTEVVEALEPFWEVSIRLQGQEDAGSHGVIWEALPLLDYLLQHCRSKMDETGVRNSLQAAYQNAWDKLREYHDPTDEAHEIYAAAALLNPCLRKEYFLDRWINDDAAYITPMMDKNKHLWKTRYSQILPEEPSEEFESLFDAFLARIQHKTAAIEEDEFDRYVDGPREMLTKWKEQSLFKWWMEYPSASLRQWAFNTLSIPSTSTEIERVFASSTRTIPVDCNDLSAESFEELQCMKQWLDSGLLK